MKKWILFWGLVLIISNFTIIFLQARTIRQQDARYRAELLLYNVAYVWVEEFDITKYTLAHNECGKKKSHKEYGLTASGRRAIPGWTAATDPDVVPPKSFMITSGGDFLCAEDTGSGVKGRNIDIFIGQGTKSNVKRANEWGRHRDLVFVIETGGKNENR